jgi:branched-subunit amino acid transport protein
MTLAVLFLALGTFLIRFLPWRKPGRLHLVQAGPALVVALFLVSAFSPPPSWAWLKTLATLGATYLAERLFRNLGLAVLVGMVLYALF